jgi:hypothetical protein
MKNLTLLAPRRNEMVALGVILCLLAIAFTVNMRISLRKGRDAQRRGDARTVQNIVSLFQDKYGYYPDSVDGKIVGCESGQFDKYEAPIFRACEWGWDKAMGISIPTDPKTVEGRRYRYESVRDYYQTFASLEESDDEEYSQKVNDRALWCGNVKCNFGVASGDTPIEANLVEYQAQMRHKKK